MQRLISEAFETMPDGRYNWQHIVLVSKYRYKVFKKQKTIDCVKSAFHEVEQQFGFKIRELGFGEDFAHVHMLVAAPGKFSPSQLLQIFKSHSAHRVFEEIPNFLKRYPNREFWNDFRYNGSVGPMNEPTVRNYIKKQDIQQRQLTEFQ